MCQQTNTKDIAGQSVRNDTEEKMYKRKRLNDVNEKKEELMQKMERMENQLENIAYKTNQYVHNMYYIYAKVTLHTRGVCSQYFLYCRTSITSITICSPARRGSYFTCAI